MVASKHVATCGCFAGTVFVVDRPGAGQATVAAGELGISLGDPDVFPLDVLGDIFNSFGGKLFDEIRSREVNCAC